MGALSFARSRRLRALPLQSGVDSLREDLATTDEAAISLYETLLEKDEVNAAQDDALIELYEKVGG